ncbi:hypothetical protein BU24DRAFT_199165 [Aaosphaeria arxii CBS 175.79]|uniref:Uncharacterized protein n=1 Tax=Aaosphaeria arxii CBS 175.79 TaxID=1450172 RepID=A0A6A5XUD4_9PLEO|nr:uncharacterized protein BU24DRAFT_199165 [Aaosphaeria arxii CBS 175.79]KAF2016321.1 hypothetical protein BU24DRAFT_199165 [Aaosphaeria arxii CBS 175.79]
MQSPAAARRVFSMLASKIHPQLPLSPRESQQLLNLLTTSFRAHLDREHPVSRSEGGQNQKLLPAPPRGLRNAPSSHPVTSQGSTHEHIDSILSNPLFASRPRRTSDSNISDAREVLQDPLGWFMGLVAMGNADIAKADLCLSILYKEPLDLRNFNSTHPAAISRPGTKIAEWLWASGSDNSLEFFSNTQLVRRLVPLLIAEGQSFRLWQWLEFVPARDVSYTKEQEKIVAIFKHIITKNLMAATIVQNRGLDEAFMVFARAFRILSTSEQAHQGRILRRAGSMLTDYIIANPSLPTTTAFYESFMESSKTWGGVWSRGINASLWLFHPSKRSAQPGLEFLKDPAGATLRMKKATKERRDFLVQLCLGVARQLLADKNYQDAQFVLHFSREHFPELLGATGEHAAVRKREGARQALEERKRKETENLAMLDRVLPT